MTSYLQFERLEKRYGSIVALHGVDLAIPEGSRVAVLGPNGSGKSTLFACLLGLVQPTGGRALYKGIPVTTGIRQRFGYLAERVALYPHRSVAENASFFLQLKQADPGELSRQLERVGLAAYQDRKVRHLSKGLLQRLGLAIALAGRPELLVLDEPFNGLDPLLLDQLLQIIQEEQERGATVLISTHTISIVESIATHAVVLIEGQLAAFGSLAQLREMHPDQDSLESIYYHIARSRLAPKNGPSASRKTSVLWNAA
jgi:ABC-type multidrug transport system ATPase subunit